MAHPWIVGVGIIAVVLGVAYGVRNQVMHPDETYAVLGLDHR
jgi:hypothetical protein